MQSNEFMNRLLRDEGRSGGKTLLRLIAEGEDEVEMNVWNIYIDHERGVVRYEHDFDPHEGELPLAELVAALRSRVEGPSS